MASHFWKTLTIFIVMIVIGLIGVVLVSNLSDDKELNNSLNTGTQFAN